jgi:BirA family biotin operon repressor/biotin-[acetyl-CoA-carboxylase] ligase
MTFFVKPCLPPEEMQRMTLAAGIAACRAVKNETGGVVKPVIKWPNDVLVQGRKLCGILSESAEDSVGALHALIGIGLNTRTPSAGWGGAEGIAISLEQAAGRIIPRMKLAASILNNMEELLDIESVGGFSAISQEYRQHMLPAGSLIVVIDKEKRRRGRIEGLDDGGGLLVRLDTGEIERIVSGEITVRGANGYV